MPFPMSHLCIAKKIANMQPELISNLPSYYLGALSPDSVHFISPYNSNYKKNSHLCVGDEKWGEVTNNAEWIENVIKFFRTRTHQNSDFIYGYCTHILSDIYNNIHIWTPFRLKYLSNTPITRNNLYHEESAQIDLQLYQSCNYKDELWQHLKNADPVSIPNITSNNETEKIRNNILYIQYNNKSPADTSNHTLITYGDTLSFISSAATFTYNHLLQG